MSFVAFLLLPFVTGLAASRRKPWVILTILLALKAALFALAVFAFQQPLIAAGLTTVCLSGTAFVLGLLLGTAIPTAETFRPTLVISVGLVLVSTAFNGSLPAELRSEEVLTSVTVPRSTESVWNSVKGFGAIAGERPLLLRLGMPTPLRCELEKEEVGARRVCHFDQGRIEQRVTVWEPPLRLGLEILESDLPFQLFSFNAASYVLTVRGEKTEVVRSTTLSSRLVPAWFWRPLERATVEAEHLYLLNSLRNVLPDSGARGD